LHNGINPILPAAGTHSSVNAMKALLFFALSGLAALTADDIPKPMQGTSSVAFSTDKDGNKNVTIHNVTYLFQDGVYLESGKDAKAMAFLIAQDQSSSVQMQSDTPPDSKIKATVWGNSDGLPRKQLWTLATKGDSGEIEDRFYAVTRDGFEDDFPCHAYFRLADGKQAYLSNTPLLTIYPAGENAGTRYVGFRDQFEDNELTKAQIAKKIAGIVSYGDGKGALKKIAIYGWPEDDKPSPPSAYLIYDKARVESDTLYVRENKDAGVPAPSGFSVVIVLSDGFEAEIPFENDVPQLDRARLPKGFTAELIP